MFTYIRNDILIMQSLPAEAMDDSPCDVIIDLRSMIKGYKLKVDPAYNFLQYWCFDLHTWYEMHREMSKTVLANCKSDLKRLLRNAIDRGLVAPLAILSVIYCIEKDQPLPVVRMRLKQVHCLVCSKLIPEAQCCTKCKAAVYCSTGCQKADWASHKKVCKAPEFRVSF